MLHTTGKALISFLVATYVLLATFSQLLIIGREKFTPEQLADQEYGRFLQFDKANVYYEYYPINVAGSKTIVFLHSFSDNLHTWDLQKDFFDDEYNLLFVDLLGHGLSQDLNNTQLGPDSQARMVVELLDELDIEKAYLIGHSMGGGIAQRVAVDHPEIIEKLALVASMDMSATGVPWGTVSWLSFTNNPGLLQVPFGLFLNKHTFYNTLASAYQNPSEFPEEVAEKQYIPYTIKTSTSNLVAHSFVQGDDRNTDQEKLSMPVLNITAANDNWIPEAAKIRNSSIPGVSNVEIPQAGHLVHIEKSDEVNEYINTWLLQ